MFFPSLNLFDVVRGSIPNVAIWAQKLHPPGVQIFFFVACNQVKTGFKVKLEGSLKKKLVLGSGWAEGLHQGQI